MNDTPPPEDTAPFRSQDPERGGAVQWNDRTSRRRFLASTGKAGAVTILGFHGLKVEVLAESPSGSAIM